MPLHRVLQRMLRVFVGCIAFTGCSDSNGPELPLKGAMPGDIYSLWRYDGQYDELFITITRADGDLAFDSTITSPSSLAPEPDVIPVRMPSMATGEVLDVRMVLRGGGVNWYEAHAPASVVSNALVFSPLTPIYIGPPIDSLSASLVPAVVWPGDSALLEVTAWHNGVVVPNVPVNFSTTDDRITTVRRDMMSAVVHTSGTIPDNVFPVVASLTNAALSVSYLQVQGAPILRLSPSFGSLGNRLQQLIFLEVNRAVPSGTQVTIRGSRAGIAFSTTDSMAGSDSLVLTMGSNGGAFWVQSTSMTTGRVVITATADAFVAGQVSVPVVTPGVQLRIPTELERNLDVLNVRVEIGIPDSTGTSLWYLQSLAPGNPPLTVSVASDGPDHLRILDYASGAPGMPTGIGTISPRSNGTPNYPAQGGLAVRTLDDGVAQVTTSIPGFTTMSGSGRSITVSAPKPIVTQHDTIIGAGLTGSFHVLLSRNPSATGTLRITSSDPTKLRFSRGNISAASDSLEAVLPGASGFFYAQTTLGASGDVSAVLSTDSYGSDTVTFTIVPPIIYFEAYPANIFTLGQDSYALANLGISLAPNSYRRQSRAANTPIPVTLTSSNPQVVGVYDSSNALGSSSTRQAGLSASTFRLRTVGRGLDTLHVSAPGFGQVPASTLVFNVP